MYEVNGKSYSNLFVEMGQSAYIYVHVLYIVNRCTVMYMHVHVRVHVHVYTCIYTCRVHVHVHYIYIVKRAKTRKTQKSEASKEVYIECGICTHMYSTCTCTCVCACTCICTLYLFSHQRYFAGLSNALLKCVLKLPLLHYHHVLLIPTQRTN